MTVDNLGYPSWIDTPTEFWTDEEVLEWLKSDFPDCVGCDYFTDGGECVVPLEDELDLECCYQGEIITALEHKLSSESKLKGDKDE